MSPLSRPPRSRWAIPGPSPRRNPCGGGCCGSSRGLARYVRTRDVSSTDGVAQPMTVLLELRRRLGIIGPIGRIEGTVELLGGVEEVDELNPLGKHAAEEGPVVLRPVGNLDQFQVRALAQHRLDLRGHHGLERRLLRLRHPRHAHRREPLSHAVIPRPRGAARLPVSAALVFIGAITPSSGTATVHAVSATSSVSSRTLASSCGRCASQRAESALGNRSSELLEGVILPSTPNTYSALRSTN